ncbi:MAG: hypothetical protein K6U00_11685, partial [Armatimonadetes bacterium]|nr:hypothetical protein [Armatimonadota bacterium]
MRLLVGFLVLIMIIYTVSPLLGQDLDIKVDVGNNGGTANAAGDASDASEPTRTSPSASSQSSPTDAMLSDDAAAPSDAPGGNGEITGNKVLSGSGKQSKRTSNGTKASGRISLDNTRVSMSFDKADVNSVIKFLSMSSGIPIVVDPELKGNVTIIS